MPDKWMYIKPTIVHPNPDMPMSTTDLHRVMITTDTARQGPAQVYLERLRVP